MLIFCFKQMPRPPICSTLAAGAYAQAEESGRILVLHVTQDDTSDESSSSSASSASASDDGSDMSVDAPSSLSSPSLPSSVSLPSASVSSVSSMDTDNTDQDESGSESMSDDNAAFRFYEATMHELRAFLEALRTERVLFPNPSVPKQSHLHLVLDSYYHHHPNRFRRNLRVSPDTFHHLVNLIINDPIFQNNSNSPQCNPIHQLAIALFRFGHFGNASSVSSIAQWAGYSEGLVVSATRRVMIALHRLHDLAMAAPLDEEIYAAMAFTAQQSCPAWAPGWCMVDGTLVPLLYKPGYYGEAYFDRKSNYSYNVQVSGHPTPPRML